MPRPIALLVLAAGFLVSGCGMEGEFFPDEPAVMPQGRMVVAVVPGEGTPALSGSVLNLASRWEAFVYAVDSNGQQAGLLKESVPLAFQSAEGGVAVTMAGLPPGDAVLEIYLSGIVAEGRKSYRRIVLASASRRLRLYPDLDSLVTFTESDLDMKTFDFDGDGLSNLEEIQKGTSPLLSDTDADRVVDSLDTYPLNNSLSGARR